MAPTPSASPDPRPPPTLSVELTGDVGQLASLRRLCARALSALPAAVVGDVQFVVTELASNVIRHTPRHTGRVLIEQQPDEVHVEVSDSSSAPPRLLHGTSIGGRGIQIVGTVARTWGVTSEPFGKTVWADIGIV